MTSIDDMYRPPQAPAPSPSGAPFRTTGASLKWIYGALALVRLVADATGNLQTGQGVFLLALVVGLVWLHRAWSDIPQEDRSLTALGDVSPGAAIGRLFIPFYNLYWTFAVHAHLNQALTESLGKRGIPNRAEPELAYAAAALGLAGRVLSSGVPVLGIGASILSMGVWFAYMNRCDTFRRMVVLAWHAEREAA